MKKIMQRSVHAMTEMEHLHPILQRVYAARGVTSSKELELDLKALHPFVSLSNITEAVTHIIEAITQQQHIMVIGDFDADGATSTTVAVKALKSFGLQSVTYLVPNRFDYGYGLTPEIVAVAAQQHPNLLLTVDNGISSHEGVLAAHALGMKVIITDHHLPGTHLPLATAIVNPNLVNDHFPSKNLAGVGVVFYLMLAIRAQLRELNWFQLQHLPDPNLAELLDLVALGTVADVVELDQNNRILVHNGLQRIRNNKVCPGIKALFAVAGKDINTAKVNDLGFVVAPRLNAAGRLVDMRLGIECLLASSYEDAYAKAYELDQLNKERQTIEKNMREEAIGAIDILPEQSIAALAICLYDENWHQGVIGILAARLKDRYHRPAFVFAKSNDNELKGSVRSINGLHVRDLIEKMAVYHPDLILKFGGHAMAAGLTIKHENFERFRTILNDTLRKDVPDEIFQEIVYSDGQLTPEDYSMELVNLLKEGGPWGRGFPEPVFDGEFQVIQHQLLKEKHLKLTLTPMNYTNYIEAIAFNVNLELLKANFKEIKAVYKLDINEFKGRCNVQLLIEHFEVR